MHDCEWYLLFSHSTPMRVTSTLRVLAVPRVHLTIDGWMGSNVCTFRDGVSCMDARDSKGTKNSQIGITSKSALPLCELKKWTQIVSAPLPFELPCCPPGIGILAADHWLEYWNGRLSYGAFPPSQYLLSRSSAAEMPFLRKIIGKKLNTAE